MNSKKLISIVFPVYNEEENIVVLYKKIKKVTLELEIYNFEIIAIDNNSTDSSREILKEIAASDSNFKVIFNTRNFGHIRSPYYGILQSNGNCTVYLASDLQDPPELIPDFIKEWESGYKLVMATKPVSMSSALTHFIRRTYYRFLDGISDVTIINDATGFGLYDEEVVRYLRNINDPYPFLRGLICDLGFKIKTIDFVQQKRVRGISKNNIYTLYDIAMLGIVSHSLIPIRLASFLGFVIGCLSIVCAAIFFILKILYWDTLPIGIAPLLIANFFFFGLIMLFIGILGEYVGSIHTYVKKRPIVVEEERINFK